MTEIEIRPDEEYIKLGQLLKKSGAAGSGTDAKILIEDGLVNVNGKTENRRGRKIYPGDEVEFEGEIFKAVK